MKFTPLNIPDVVLIEPEVHSDPRGTFCMTYHADLFARHGITTKFVQDNRSISSPGVLRGLHFQVAPCAQAKLVTVLRGKAFDVAVDLRKDSKTFGQFIAHTLDEESRQLLYIPAGFAHGFCVLEGPAEFFYKVSEVYSPAQERGIIWNDPSLAIPWPRGKGQFIISEKDKKFPTLKEYMGGVVK